MVAELHAREGVRCHSSVDRAVAEAAAIVRRLAGVRALSDLRAGLRGSSLLDTCKSQGGGRLRTKKGPPVVLHQRTSCVVLFHDSPCCSVRSPYPAHQQCGSARIDCPAPAGIDFGPCAVLAGPSSTPAASVQWLLSDRPKKTHREAAAFALTRIPEIAAHVVGERRGE